MAVSNTIKRGDLVRYRQRFLIMGQPRKIYLVKSVDNSNGWLHLIGVESIVFANLMEKVYEAG